MERTVKVLVINGSPKGEYSLTLQHSLYMVGQMSDVEWKVLSAGEALSPIQYDPVWLDSAIADISWCDAIVWTTPVYTMLVPWQLIRLLRLIKDAGKNDIFRGKYATSMMTCFHYYDNLAEDWLRGMSEDLGMYYLEGRTADNMDMLKMKQRDSMRFFMQEFIDTCRQHRVVERKYLPISYNDSRPFRPGVLATPSDRPSPRTDAVPKTVLLTDETGKDGNLSRMIDVFVSTYPYPVEIVDINDFPYEAGCHGCLKCELVGECDRKDGFQAFYFNLVNSCDVLVFGMNLEDRYIRPVWKLFLDRSFSNGHRTSMMGKHTTYLVSGPLRSLPSVRLFLEAKDNVGRENAMGIISDEYDSSEELQELIQETAKKLARAVDSKYQKSINFLGIGGIKIFRDLIYSMRGVVPDDHQFYRRNGLYDFPQKDVPKQLFNLGMGIAFKAKPVRLQAWKRMPKLYIQLHKNIVDSGRR